MEVEEMAPIDNEIYRADVEVTRGDVLANTKRAKFFFSVACKGDMVEVEANTNIKQAKTNIVSYVA